MAQEHPGWWSRHWKWALPSGCLVLVLLLFGGCAAMVAGVFGMMKSGEPYRDAIARVQHDEAAIAALGEPIDTGWWIAGNYSENPGTGSADYTVPVSGPRGTGTLYVEARKHEGRWRFTVLSLVPDGSGDPIDLRTDDEIADAEGAPMAGLELPEPPDVATDDDLPAVEESAEDEPVSADPTEADPGDGTKPLRYGSGRTPADATPRHETPDARERDRDPSSSSI